MGFTEGIIHSLEMERFSSIKLCVTINLSQDVVDVDVILRSHHFSRHMTLLFCIHQCVELEKSLSRKCSYRLILFIFEQCDVHIYSTDVRINCRHQPFETHS